MAPHSSPLAWKIPWMEEPGGLQSMPSWRVGRNWATSLSLHFQALGKEMATHSSVLAWRIPWTGEPGGLPSVGSHRVRDDWSDLAAVAAHTNNAQNSPSQASAVRKLWKWKRRVKKLAYNSTFRKLVHGIWSHHFMENRRGKSGNGERLYFGGFQNHCRCLLLGIKVMTNLDRILKAKMLLCQQRSI